MAELALVAAFSSVASAVSCRATGADANTQGGTAQGEEQRLATREDASLDAEVKQDEATPRRIIGDRHTMNLRIGTTPGKEQFIAGILSDAMSSARKTGLFRLKAKRRVPLTPSMLLILPLTARSLPKVVAVHAGLCQAGRPIAGDRLPYWQTSGQAEIGLAAGLQWSWPRAKTSPYGRRPLLAGRYGEYARTELRRPDCPRQGRF